MVTFNFPDSQKQSLLLIKPTLVNKITEYLQFITFTRQRTFTDFQCNKNENLLPLYYRENRGEREREREKEEKKISI